MHATPAHRPLQPFGYCQGQWRFLGKPHVSSSHAIQGAFRRRFDVVVAIDGQPLVVDLLPRNRTPPSRQQVEAWFVNPPDQTQRTVELRPFHKSFYLEPVPDVDLEDQVDDEKEEKQQRRTPSKQSEVVDIDDSSDVEAVLVDQPTTPGEVFNNDDDDAQYSSDDDSYEREIKAGIRPKLEDAEYVMAEIDDGSKADDDSDFVLEDGNEPPKEDMELDNIEENPNRKPPPKTVNVSLGYQSTNGTYNSTNGSLAGAAAAPTGLAANGNGKMVQNGNARAAWGTNPLFVQGVAMMTQAMAQQQNLAGQQQQYLQNAYLRTQQANLNNNNAMGRVQGRATIPNQAPPTNGGAMAGSRPYYEYEVRVPVVNGSMGIRVGMNANKLLVLGLINEAIHPARGCFRQQYDVIIGIDGQSILQLNANVAMEMLKQNEGKSHRTLRMLSLTPPPPQQAPMQY